jgi:tetratricopeptide (TPR) repeat protein
VGAVTANLSPRQTCARRGCDEPSRALARTSYSVRIVPARSCEWPLRRWLLGVLRAAALVALWGVLHAVNAQASAQSHADGDTASTSPEYDKALDRALDAFEAQDYARARELFERAYEIRPNARVLRGLGISALHLERFTVAKRELKEALRESKQPLTANQRDGVTELLSWMQLNLGTLQLRLQPAKARVMLDDEPVTGSELVLKPGAHRVFVNADGFASQEHEVEIAAGQEKTLEVALSQNAVKSPEAAAVSAAEAASTVPIDEPAEASPPIGRLHEPTRDRESSTVFERWWFWTAVGVVVAGGVATTVALTSTGPAKSYEHGGLGGVIMPLGRTP